MGITGVGKTLFLKELSKTKQVIDLGSQIIRVQYLGTSLIKHNLHKNSMKLDLSKIK